MKIAGLAGPVFLHAIDESTFTKICREPDYLASQGVAVKAASTLELGPYSVMRLTAR